MPNVDYPARAIVTCMDFRVSSDQILRHLGWDQGLHSGAYVIRNAGGSVTQDAIRSLMLLQKFVLKGTYDIKVAVVAHTKCGMIHKSGDDELNEEIERDVWFGERPSFALETFPSPELGVRRSVQRLLNSRWVASRSVVPLAIRGLIYNVDDNSLSEVKYHIVKEMETWARVAGQYYLEEEVLKAANPQADHSKLRSGQVLYIPIPAS
jgi:carbonic anhydrase